MCDSHSDFDVTGSRATAYGANSHFRLPCVVIIEAYMANERLPRPSRMQIGASHAELAEKHRDLLAELIR